MHIARELPYPEPRYFVGSSPGMNAIVRMLAVYAGLSLLLCAMTQMEWSPLQANGFRQWVPPLLLIFPAAAAAEFLGERLLRKRAPVDFEESKTHADCSW